METSTTPFGSRRFRATRRSARAATALLLLAALCATLAPQVSDAAVINPTAVLSGPSAVDLGSGFTLDGSRSSAAGRIVAWRWRWVPGTATAGFAPFTAPGSTVVTTSPTLDLTVSSTPPSVGAHDFELVVVDDAGLQSSPATARVLVRDATKPTAVLRGPTAAGVSSSFLLDASASSDVGGKVKQFDFRLTSAPVGSVGHPLLPSSSTTFSTTEPLVTVRPGATLPLPGRYVYSLVVVDDSGNVSDPALVTVLLTDDVAPTAVLRAPTTVSLATPFTLDGSASTDAGAGLVKLARWEWLAGPAGVTAAGPFTSTARLLSTADLRLAMPGTLPVGRYTFSLVVTDDSGNVSSAATATVIVVDDARPTAVISAPTTASNAGALVLDGSRSSDVGGRVVSWTWTLVSAPTGSVGYANLALGVPFASADPTITLTPGTTLPVAGTYQFRLVVGDDSGNVSEPAIVAVQLTASNPTAVPSLPTFVPFGASLVLDSGRSFAADGRIMISTWRWVSGPAGSSGFTALPTVGSVLRTLDTRFTLLPGTVRPVPGRYEFSLVVTDDSGRTSSAATAAVIVVDDTAPTAVLAAPTAPVSRLASFALDANRSSDIGGKVVEYVWSYVSGPLGTAGWVQLSPTNPRITTADPTLLLVPGTTRPAIGSYTFGLTVIDDAGNASSPALVKVVVADLTPPVVAPHADIVVETKLAAATVFYKPPSAVDGAVTVSCAAANGSAFFAGSTKVVCTAKDAGGNTGRSAFLVTVSTPSTIGAVTNPGNLDRVLTKVETEQKVRVTAGGFAPGSPVSILLVSADRSTSITDTTAGADGRIDVRFKIPRRARGTVQITAVGNDVQGRDFVRAWGLTVESD